MFYFINIDLFVSNIFSRFTTTLLLLNFYRSSLIYIIVVYQIGKGN